MKKLILLLVIYYSLSISNYSFSQWVQMSNGMGTNQFITSFVSNSNFLFTGSAENGVFRSSNSGAVWEEKNKGLTNVNITSLYVYNNTLYAGTYGGGIFTSSDDGSNWNESNTGLTNLFVNCIYSRNNILYAGTSTASSNTGGVYYSTNNGLNWIFTGLNNYSVSAFTASGNFLFAGAGEGAGVYRSSNNGLNWVSVNNGLFGNTLNANDLESNGSNVYLCSGNGIYLTINNGANWNCITIGLPYLNVHSISMDNSNFFIGTDNGVYISTNYGQNWTLKNQGFSTTYNINSVYISNGYIFAGANGQSVWRRLLTEIIGIQKISEVIPKEYSLEQNYPNPFNSSSKIKYEISKLTDVKIIVYDMLGREVVTLVNEKHTPGVYEVTFNGAQYSSGIYFYKIITDEYSETKKMILLK